MRTPARLLALLIATIVAASLPATGWASEPDEPAPYHRRHFDLVDLPFDVGIDTASVGGPSAGLALTLAVLDVLTPGELTGGTGVATTGTIDVFGNVGPIGGAEQKAHAVRRAGIDVFLVPVANFEEAKAGAGDDLEVIAISTLDEALAVLAERGGVAEGTDLLAAAS